MTSFEMQGSFYTALGECGRIRVSDTGTTYTFQFGMDGMNIGLYTVNIPKSRLENLNLFGALEVALGRLCEDHKQSENAGKTLEQLMNHPARWKFDLEIEK